MIANILTKGSYWSHNIISPLAEGRPPCVTTQTVSVTPGLSQLPGWGGRKEGRQTHCQAPTSLSHYSLLCTVWNNIPFTPSHHHSLPLCKAIGASDSDGDYKTTGAASPPKQSVFQLLFFSGPGATRSTVNNKHGPTRGRPPRFSLADSLQGNTHTSSQVQCLIVNNCIQSQSVQTDWQL